MNIESGPWQLCTSSERLLIQLHLGTHGIGEATLTEQLLHLIFSWAWQAGVTPLFDIINKDSLHASSRNTE